MEGLHALDDTNHYLARALIASTDFKGSQSRIY
jgi:hypothetical protein